MKTLFITIFLFIVFLAGVNIAQAAPGISIEATPSSAKVGDKISISIKLESAPFGDNVYLYISDAIIDKGDLSDASAHLKARWDPPGFGKSANYSYVWNTQAAGSNPGLHYITAIMTTHDPLVIPEPKFGIVALENHVTYTLSASSTMPTPTGGSGGGTTPTPDESLTPTPATTSGSAVGGFDLGKLGKIVFPPTKVNSPQELIVTIINWMIWLLGILAVVAIVYSGIMYITAGGDTARAESARKNLTWAVIGLVIVLLSLVMVNYIHSVIG
ncbi:MAG: conserved rane protein of unknown function [Candidatus Berkelbacteria bacterium]|nr:conserved rane protein of unknown function [Candidatus Berkelbacteria bacterium]